MLNIQSELAMLTSQINNLVSILACPYFGDYSSSWYASSAPRAAPPEVIPAGQENDTQHFMHVTNDNDVSDNEVGSDKYFKDLQSALQAESSATDVAHLVGSWEPLDWRRDDSNNVNTPPTIDAQSSSNNPASSADAEAEWTDLWQCLEQCVGSLNLQHIAGLSLTSDQREQVLDGIAEEGMAVVQRSFNTAAGNLMLYRHFHRLHRALRRRIADMAPPCASAVS
jgi:hypothetical protein